MNKHYLSQDNFTELLSSVKLMTLASLRSAVLKKLDTNIEPDNPLSQHEQIFSNDSLPSRALDEYVADYEKQLIKQTLQRCGGNKSQAARILGLRPNTLHYKLERYGLLEKSNIH